jgi:cold-inducible RNA-binding protein
VHREFELGKTVCPVEYAKARQRSLEFPLAKGATLKKLYVGNLPFQATEQDISNWIKQAGATVATLTLVTDKFTGQPRGFAFVEINNDEEAARVIQSLNGQDFMGRNVVVNEARPRDGGGYGGGGRGREGGGRGGDRGGGGGRGRY